MRQRRAANPTKEADYNRIWSAAHRDKRRETLRQWRAAHPEYERTRGRREYIANPGRYVYHAMKRVTAKANRIPRWLTPDDFKTIEIFYDTANHFTTVTGVKYAVDHYYPLQGKTVSGLHVPANLQVIPAALNLRKGNKHPDEFRR